MFYNILFFITRLFILNLTGLFIVAQVKNLIKHKGFNGETRTRKAFFIFITTIFADSFLLIISDIHGIFFKINRFDWVETVQGILLITRLVQLYGLLYFFRYVFLKGEQNQ